jgi:single-strand DNA-binding protein
MNVISISGNVTKDGEIRQVGQDDVLQFSVADNMIGKDKGAIFWNCSLWGKRATSLADFIRKGQPVTVIGSVSERSYVDKDGNQKKAIDVRVTDVALQGGKPQGQESTQRPAPRQEAPRQSAPRPSSGFDDMDDDIPF